jgi:hypothetical protein
VKDEVPDRLILGSCHISDKIFKLVVCLLVMAGLLDPFLKGLGGQSAPPPPPPPPGQPGSRGFIPRAETRRTPPLSVVRAEIDGPDGTLYSGQLWDISHSGASISFGRNTFEVPKETEVQLRLRSRHGPELVTMTSTVRWMDVNYGATFVGLQFANPVKPGTFLDTFLDANAEML